MKWRHWAILIVLLLLNYIVFSAALTRMAKQQRAASGTRTPMPTFTVLAAGPVGWVVLPTNTILPAGPTSTPTLVPVPTIEPSLPPADTPAPAETATVEPAESPLDTATSTSAPSETPSPTETSEAQYIVHTVKRGEYLSVIARQYGVSVQAIVNANNLADPNHIEVGQQLVIPLAGQAAVPTATSRPAEPTSPPVSPPRATATATRNPPTATSAPATATPRPAGFQFTGSVVWDPWVAPNCSGPAIARQSVVQDTAGNPVNGVRVEITCYGNVWWSHPSGNPGEYEPGHYDFAFGQMTPQEWTCTASVYDLNGERVTSSQVVTIYFDTNECQPGGSGHQVAIVNWVKNW